MTKFEVREYLTKIYDVSVKEVRTANMLGELDTRLTSIAAELYLINSRICRAMEALLRQEEADCFQEARREDSVREAGPARRPQDPVNRRQKYLQSIFLLLVQLFAHWFIA